MRRLSSTSTWFCKRAWLAARDREKRWLALADVLNVKITMDTHPWRVAVILRGGARLGTDVGLMPASPHGRPDAFRPDPITSELIERVDMLWQGAR